MSSIRNEDLAISEGDLAILDEFMFSLGFSYYPINNIEQANMPWSTRWYKHDVTTLTDGRKNAWHVSPDVAQFLYQHLTVKSE